MKLAGFKVWTCLAVTERGREMKVSGCLGLIVVASLLLFSGVTGAHAPTGVDVGAAADAGSPARVALTGYVREGQFRDPDTSKSIRYLYLELKEPIGKYVNNLKPSENGYRKIELVAGSSTIIHRLEALLGKRVTVQGELPFTFDANAPKVVLPLVMDASYPELFK